MLFRPEKIEKCFSNFAGVHKILVFRRLRYKKETVTVKVKP